MFALLKTEKILQQKDYNLKWAIFRIILKDILLAKKVNISQMTESM